MLRFSIGLVCLASLISAVAAASETVAGADGESSYSPPLARGGVELGVSVGYAWGFEVGRPNPQLEALEMLSFAPRVGLSVADPVGRGQWWETSVQLFVEGTLLWQLHPKSGVAVGAALLIRVNALGAHSRSRIIPFFSIGGGVVSLDFDLSDQDDGTNFTPQLGLGVRYMLGHHSSLEFEWRYHHISNANTHSPNHGINTNLFSLGTSIFF